MPLQQRYVPEKPPANQPASTPTLAETHPNDKPPPPPDKPVEMGTKLLKDIGLNLPCGILSPDGMTRVKPFRLRPFRLKDEKALAKLRETSRGMTFGGFVSDVMARMIHTVGPHSFDITKDPEKQIILSQMLLADVLYMYVYLRYESMGADEPIELRFTCPACRHIFDNNFDLGEMEVKVVGENDGDLRRKFHLRDGLMVGGSMRHDIWLAPLKWGISNSDSFGESGGQSTALVIQNSIVGIEGIDLHPFAISDDDLDEMSKFDVEALKRDIGEASPGPQMMVSTDCTKCKLKIAKLVDWGYDSFFSRASQPTIGKV